MTATQFWPGGGGASTGGEIVTPGSGLTKTGTTLNVGANADNTITVNADDIQVNSTNVEITSRKGAASGYASLDGTTKVPIGQVPTGTTGTTVALGNHNHSGVYDPAGTASSAISTHVAAADPHTGYQLESEKAAVNGYASLDGATKVPIAQVPTGTTASTVALGNHNHDTAYVQLATIAAKGDLYAGTANDTVGILTIGSNTQVLTADSTQTTGMKWAAAPSSALRYAQDIGDGTTTLITVTHSLGTKDLVVAVYNKSTSDVVSCGVNMFSTTQVKLNFAVAPTTNAYRVVVVG